MVRPARHGVLVLSLLVALGGCGSGNADKVKASFAQWLQALRQGDTLGPRRRPCVHWIRTGKDRWIAEQRASGWMIVAVELADGAIALPRLGLANQRTVILLGHEWHGIPEEHVDAADICVEIPMVGQGASLNVAVAGSLVLYRLAGMA